MEKPTSCGSIIVKDNKMLLALPYQNPGWNLPKGTMNENESYLETAKRETLEECNIDIDKSIKIEDLGEFKYLKNKNLHLFLVVIDYEPELKCNSTFLVEKSNIIAHEMVAYRWVELDGYSNYISIALKSVIDSVIPKIKSILFTS